MTALIARLATGSIQARWVMRMRPPATTSEEQGAKAVDRHPDGGDGHDRQTRGGPGGREPLHGFPGDAAGHQQQKRGVGERGQDRGAPQAVGVALARRAPSEVGSQPGHGEPHDIAEVVRGVGKQGQRPRIEPEDDFADYVGEIERHADGEGAAHGLRAMAMAMGVAVVMMMAVVMVVGGARHRGGHSTPRADAGSKTARPKPSPRRWQPRSGPRRRRGTCA